MIRIVQWGCGAMGCGMMALTLKKRNLQLVGAIDSRMAIAGRDVGERLESGRKIGVEIRSDAEQVLKETRPDVVLLATSSFTRDVFEPLSLIAEHGADAITIAEEMAAPRVKAPELARRLDELALARGMTILGTGINPGFVLDSLILMLTGVCQEITAIEAARVNDLSPYGQTVMRTQGIGLAPEEFRRGVADGSVDGHIGFAESIAMLSERLNLEIDDVVEEKAPIITSVARETACIKVAPGMVAGCNHTAKGLRKGQPVITLNHPQQILPQLENQHTGDFINISGRPELHLRIEPEIPGGIGTVAIAVNMIPAVLAAAPGLKMMSDMPLPYCLPNLKAI